MANGLETKGADPALTVAAGSVRRYIEIARDRGIDEEDYGDAEYYTRLAIKEIVKLEERVKNLEEAENTLRDGVIDYIKTDEEDRSVDTLKFLLDATQWWDWELSSLNVED